LSQLTRRLQVELNRQLVTEHGISLADYELLGRLHGSARGGLRARDLMDTLA
jgi:hypothetical protein